MAISPPTYRKPSTVQDVRLQNDPGLLDLEKSIALVGYRLSTSPNTFDNLLVKVKTRTEVQNLFGVASMLDLGMKKVLAARTIIQPLGGSLPSIYCVAVPPPAGLAAEYTVTFTGAATSNGLGVTDVTDIVLPLETRTTDTVTDLAVRYVDLILSRDSDMPVTASNVAGVATLVAREPGLWGNEIYVAADTTGAPGVTITVAQSVVGTTVTSMATALLNTLAESDTRVSAIVCLQGDPATGLELQTHISDAWVFSNDLPRTGFYPVSGDLSDAETEAVVMDNWRILACSNEKLVGVGTPFDVNSGHSMIEPMTAGYAAVLYSQERPNFNYNRAQIPGHGRVNLLTSELNDAINGGVSVFAQLRGSAIIWDPVTTALTDQTSVMGLSPNKEWQPVEYVKTVREIWEQTRATADIFAQADQSNQTLSDAKSAVLAILRDAASAGWIANVPDTAVTTSFSVGSPIKLIIEMKYTPLAGVDIVEVTHFVSRS